jgi:hypothetical protein
MPAGLKRQVAAPLFLGGLPFAPLSLANGGSLFSGSVLSTHCPLLTTHYSLLTTHYSLLTCFHEFADRLKKNKLKTRPQKPRTEYPPHD